MSLFLRDPLMRELLLNDYDRERYVRPYQQHYHVRPYQPVRVHRLFDNDSLVVPTFDNALSELQSVMDNVTDAINHYQGGLTKDLVAGGMRTHRTEDGNMQVAMDVAQFKPEDVNVKICDDNLVVEAKTESSENDSYHKAELKRWIKLPADCKHEAIKSTITPDKRLLIEVPMNKPIADSRSRNIPIEVQKKPVEDAKKSQQSGDQNQTQPKK